MQLKMTAAPAVRNKRRGGWVLIQALALVFVMSAIGSMSVDIGMYQVACNQLEQAADAAALAGAASIYETGDIPTATAQAVSLAQANRVLSKQLPASAITFSAGAMNNGQFVSGLTPYTTVQVQIKCTKATNNSLSLFFGQVVGVPNIDLTVTSMAKIRTAVPDYKLVGINSATFGSIGVLAQVQGRLVSNGNVKIGMPLGILVGVNGDARSYGGVTQKGPLAVISGSTAALTQQLVYPSMTLPQKNDNANIASMLDSQGNFTAIVGTSIPAGTYVVRDCNLIGAVAVNLQGPVTFYVTGNFNIAVGVNLLGNTNFSASNFKVRVTSTGYVNFLATLLVPLNIDLYAPDSDINIAVGVNKISGRLIGKTLNVALPVAGTIAEESGLPDPFTGLPNTWLAR